MVATIGVSAQLTATITSQTNAACFGLCDGSATVEATGGTAPYSYIWSGPGGFTGNTQLITGLCAGVYTVTVTDDLLETATASVTITEPLQMIINITGNMATCDLNNGSVSAFVSGGTAPYTYLWSNSMTTQFGTNLGPGVYSLTVTDGIGCSATSNITITQSPALVVSATSQPDTCGQGLGVASASSSGGTPGYTALWSTGANMFNISNLPAGLYSVTITDSQACTGTASTIVGDMSPTFDLGMDFSLCTGACDTIFPQFSGSSTPASYLWSDLSVNSFLFVCPQSSGTYSLTVTDTYGCTGTDSINVIFVEHCNTISGIFYNDLNNDGIQDAGEYPLANQIVMITPGSVFATTNVNGYYEVSVDTGTFTITPVNNAPNVTILPVSHQTVFYGSYETDSLNNFGVYFDAVYDLRVTLYSSAMRPGFSSAYYLSAYNSGGDTIDASVILHLDPTPVFNSASPAPSLQGGDSLAWYITAMPPNSQRYFYIYITIPPGTPLGTVITSDAVILPVDNDINPSNNYFVYSSVVTGSYDPNDKAVLPAGEFSPDMIAAGEYLTYTIRFQNTGTDTAFNVHIIDTLSSNLDVTTFEPVSSSHPFSFNLYGTGIVDFIFNNILLPDSNVNEPGSNGYVAYKAKPRGTLDIGEEIHNTAYIYFDFNEPVVTNTVTTIIDEIEVIWRPEATNLFLHVWPNPSNGSFRISCTGTGNLPVVIEVSDILGKTVVKEQFNDVSNGRFSKTFSVDNPGIYIVRVTVSDKVYSAKIIVTR